MTLLIQFAMIFFATLMVAGLLALGEPQAARFAAGHDGANRGTLLVLEGSWLEPTQTPRP